MNAIGRLLLCGFILFIAIALDSNVDEWRLTLFLGTTIALFVVFGGEK